MGFGIAAYATASPFVSISSRLYLGNMFGNMGLIIPGPENPSTGTQEDTCTDKDAGSPLGKQFKYWDASVSLIGVLIVLAVIVSILFFFAFRRNALKSYCSKLQRETFYIVMLRTVQHVAFIYYCWTA